MGINPLAPKEQLDKVYSWDSPSFYVHLKAVMEQAKVSGITVDLNGGSGWPVGGLHVKPEESMLTLTYADTVVKGGEKISVSVPKRLPDYAKIIIFLLSFLQHVFAFQRSIHNFCLAYSFGLKYQNE